MGQGEGQPEEDRGHWALQSNVGGPRKSVTSVYPGVCTYMDSVCVRNCVCGSGYSAYFKQYYSLNVHMNICC